VEVPAPTITRKTGLMPHPAHHQRKALITHDGEPRDKGDGDKNQGDKRILVWSSPRIPEELHAVPHRNRPSRPWLLHARVRINGPQSNSRDHRPDGYGHQAEHHRRPGVAPG
jgi:hypothetical protein